MKKLLLVLVVVAMASFLLVGCLPGVVDDGDDDGDGDGDVVVEAAIVVEDESTPANGVTYVACSKDVIVTLPEAAPLDYAVWVAVKVYDESTKLYSYNPKVVAIPNTDRTVWTVTDFPFAEELTEGECEPICIVALLKHPCCPGEEVALRIVTVDCTPPAFDLYAKFTDCAPECPAEPGECDPVPFTGVSMEWTSRAGDACETVDCCEDTCSGANGWSMVIDADPCLASCDEVPGTGCPIEGFFECECLAYAPDTTEYATYAIEFSFEDKVGNAVKGAWTLELDTDSIVSFTADTATESSTPTVVGPVEDWYQLFDLNDSTGCTDDMVNPG